MQPSRRSVPTSESAKDPPIGKGAVNSLADCEHVNFAPGMPLRLRRNCQQLGAVPPGS